MDSNNNSVLLCNNFLQNCYFKMVLRTYKFHYVHKHVMPYKIHLFFCYFLSPVWKRYISNDSFQPKVNFDGNFFGQHTRWLSCQWSIVYC